MNRRSIPRPGFLVLACACLGFPAAAEVAVEPNGYGLNLLVMGIIEDPDPICEYWTPFRDIDESLLLNPDGADRDDGRPDIVFEPTTARPHAVWSYDLQTDHDVAYSRWDGGSWTAPEFLTADVDDQTDPRIFLYEGGGDDEYELQVVWWEDSEEPEVWWTRKPSSYSSWTAPERVTDLGESGRRPSVAAFEGMIFVAYERAILQGTEIVVGTRQSGGTYDKDVVVATSHMGFFDPVLHVRGDTMWLDWKNSNMEFAYSVYLGGRWSSPVILPWTDFTWIGLDEARAVTESEVLAP